jgi:CHAT domain-containing protein
MSGARSVCLSLWRVDDKATALLMQRFYANLLGLRPGLTRPMPKAEALQEAKTWLRGLRQSEAMAATAALSGGVDRGKGEKARPSGELPTGVPLAKDHDQPDAPANLRGRIRPLRGESQGETNDRPYAAPYFWAAFVLAGDPD